ncbi:MAG: hypothetical protein KAR07_09700 [Spirochaetes bacterium]|nr:hypothetical protein [Spirochaetota bacterium]
MKKKSSLIILTVVLIAIFTAGILESFNFGSIKKITGKTGLLKKAKRIKKNLEKDVKILIASKNQLIKLKNRITRELNSIANKLKQTERHILTTKKHVGEIDDLMRGLK